MLAQLPFLTRIPESLQVAQQVIQQAWAWNHWQPVDENYRFQRIDLGHYGIEQRWLVITCRTGWHQAEEAVAKAQEKEREAIQKQLYHLQAQRFHSEEDACASLDRLARKWNYHQVHQTICTSHLHYAHKGRPTSDTPIQSIDWQLQVSVGVDSEKRRARIQGLLMVMTLALLVYAIAQRRLRQQLAQQQETLPNQIGQPTATPTWR